MFRGFSVLLNYWINYFADIYFEARNNVNIFIDYTSWTFSLVLFSSWLFILTGVAAFSFFFCFFFFFVFCFHNELYSLKVRLKLILSKYNGGIVKKEDCFVESNHRHKAVMYICLIYLYGENMRAVYKIADSQ
jgi:hypothetical protein